MHAYWLLAAPLASDGDAIERANRRLAHAVGGDLQVVNRDRVLRLLSVATAPGATLCLLVRLRTRREMNARAG